MQHIPYHFPPEYAELYPPPEQFPVAKHPTMHESQPTVAWYDQGNTLPSPVGMAAHHDVIRSGGIAGSWGSGAGQLPPAPQTLPSTPLHPRTKPMNATLARIVRRNLYAAASYVDAQLGKMLDALDELKVTNSTLVVSFGDHGQNLGEHSLWEKMSVFEPSVRVHLTIRAPWLQHSVGTSDSTVVELVSLYKTLSELAGLPPATIEPSVQGTSFASLLTGVPSPRLAAAAPDAHPEPGNGFAMSQMTRCVPEGPNCEPTASGGPRCHANPATSVYAACGGTGGTREYSYMGYSLRSAEWRLSIWAAWDNATMCPRWSDSSNQVELYDHRNDTAIVDFDSTENVNVASEPANQLVLQQLTGAVHRFFAEGCPQ